MSNNKISYRNATGVIEFTLKNDLMFHYVMQKSHNALIGLVCSLKGLSPDDVEDVIVLNPIDINSIQKETVMDLKLVMNNKEILNIELQVYIDKYRIQRSILYLCRAYDCIGEGENYSKLKPTTHICITDQELIPDNQQFYSEYLLLNTKNYVPYTENFGIKMLSLNHTDKATKDDKDNNLVYWAELFNAATWEEFQRLADGNPAIEEVGDLILELNTDNQTKEILEGQRRYREMMDSQYAAGYTDAEDKYKPIVADKEVTIAEISASNAEKDATIAEKNATIAKKDATIAEISASNAEKDAKLKADAETISKLEAELSRLRSRSDK